jgi:uncharacterized radical SAM superfamily Fe-S cluster-containing enzyme
MDGLIIEPFLGGDIGAGVTAVESVTNAELWTIMNAVNQYNPDEPRPLVLLPTLNTYATRMAYEDIINEPETTAHRVLQRRNFLFFFYKLNGQVYQVITDREATVVYSVSLIE